MHDEFSRRQFFTGLSRTLIIMNFSFGGGWVLGWGGRQEQLQWHISLNLCLQCQQPIWLLCLWSSSLTKAPRKAVEAGSMLGPQYPCRKPEKKKKSRLLFLNQPHSGCEDIWGINQLIKISLSLSLSLSLTLKYKQNKSFLKLAAKQAYLSVSFSMIL